ncbi:MAG: TIGR01459 family HAD-type hydrolase [Alphaproteobacteria bacterium GM7ARS4]|nr:TIGR01459 family HAD-type hydrolase [Alphaproteobacteria bacterium GM7ARS4]
MSTSNSTSPPSHIHGISCLVNDYDALFCDLWGVAHNGVALFPHVLHALRQWQDHKKRLVFISNAPRRAYAIAAQLRHMGMADALHDGVISSGEEAWHALTRNDKDAPYGQWGKNFYHIGPERDHNMFEGLPQKPVRSIDACSFILNSGPWGDLQGSDLQGGDHHDLHAYHAILEQGLRQKKPMICLNPDIDVIRGTKRVLCAGALARSYRQRGGVVSYHGKPYPSIYAMAHKRINERHHEPIPKQRILALGDSLTTDIAGADSYAIHSVLVLSGLHKAPIGNSIDDAYLAQLAQTPPTPHYVMTQLAW